MNLTEEDVRYVAELAHLDLSVEEVKQFRPQLAAILEYVQQLNQLDTAHVKPMAHVVAESAAESPRDISLRPDVRSESLPQDVALANAPDAGAGHFKVPAVIEKE